MALNVVPASKRVRLDFSDEIVVLAGLEETRFTVHKAIIISTKFFKVACDKHQFKEPVEQRVRLPDVNVDAFRTYLQWSYTGELALLSEGEQQSEEDNLGTFYWRLVRVYVIADALDDKHLRNRVIDEFLSIMKRHLSGPGPKAIAEVWERTAEHSTLRRLLLDWHTLHVEAEWLRHQSDILPREFFADLSVRFAETRGEIGTMPDCLSIGGCLYHEHDDELPACE